GTFEALDDNSNGIFEKATLTIRAEASIDRNSDGFPEDHSYATVDGVVLNAIEDQNPDRVELHLVATEEKDFDSDGVVDETRGAEVTDADQNGVPEETAYLRLDAQWTDADSNGVFEKVDLTFRAERMTDPNQDGVPDTHEWVSVDYHAEDVDQDGTYDNVYLL